MRVCQSFYPAVTKNEYSVNRDGKLTFMYYFSQFPNISQCGKLWFLGHYFR